MEVVVVGGGLLNCCFRFRPESLRDGKVLQFPDRHKILYTPPTKNKDVGEWGQVNVFMYELLATCRRHLLNDAQIILRKYNLIYLLDHLDVCTYMVIIKSMILTIRIYSKQIVIQRFINKANHAKSICLSLQ